MRLGQLLHACILLFLVFGLVQSTSAQLYDYVILDSESSIAGLQVNDISQDASGYLWVATNAGVSRFDGKNFTNYTVRNGLAENYATSIYCDSKNRIWVGHQSAGVSLILKDSIQHFSEENGLANNEVHDFYEDENGEMWVSTFDGLSYFEDGVWSEVVLELGQVSNNIQTVTQDDNGNFWLGTYGSGIIVLDGKDILQGNRMSSHLHMGNGLVNNYVTSIAAAQNRMIIGTLGGITEWNDGEFRAVTSNEMLGSNQINDLTVSAKNELWLATFNGVVRLQNEELLSLSERNGLPQNEVLAVFSDQENNIWLGTKAGLVRVKNLAFSHYFSTEEVDVYPSSMFVDSQNRLWVGNEAGGVLSFDGEEFVNAFEDPDINDHQISSIAEDGDGNLWFGTMDFGGLFQWDGERFYIYSDEFGLADNYINCLTTDKDGVLFIGTPNGLSTFDGLDFEIVYLSDDFATNHVTALELLDDGTIMIGSKDGSVFKYTDGQAELYELVKPESAITDITELSNGIGYATLEHGVYLDNEGVLKHILDIKGFRGSNARAIFESGNVLFVTSSNGVDQINSLTDSISIEHFSSMEGYLGGASKSGAVTEFEGQFFIGTEKGITRFDPTELKQNQSAPNVRFTELQLSYETVDWKELGYSTTASGLPTELELPYTENNLRFFFQGINHQAPEGVKYKWQLEGYEQNWTPFSDQTIANYPSLPPGNYTFKLLACNSSDVCSAEPESFSFKIRPPFWRTLWFYVVVSLSLIGLTYLFIKRRERVLLEEKQILESTVAERTKELREQKEIVEHQNQHITESIEYASNIQKAILPAEAEMISAFKDHFVFYRPKETVGGDFYWVYHSNNISWAAAVDCTGHGVSGAFMSMIGSDLLNQIVIEKQVSEPGKVLEEMDNGIKLAFAQSAKEFESDQGMDVSLVRIDHAKKSLQFAGAQRPLFVFMDDELTEVEGDKVSISCADELEKTFETHHLNYKENTAIYLFSDGITDQFGGERGKKFMVRRVRDFLSSNHHNTMEEQHTALIKTFDDWKGEENNQIDDVMLLGIRL